MSDTPPTNNRRRKHRGWLLLVIALLLFSLLVYLDTHMKKAPHAGYIPANHNTLLYANDLSYFWTRTQKTDFSKILNNTLSKEIHTLQATIRIQTGIRPTPERWELYLGPSTLIAESDGQWGLCARPGLILRSLHLVRSIFINDVDGLYSMGPYIYTWHDQFLLCSTDPDWILAARDNPKPTQFKEIPATDTLHIALNNGPKITLSARDGLPIDGHWNTKLPATPTTQNHIPVSTVTNKALISALTNDWPLTLFLFNAALDQLPQPLQNHYATHFQESPLAQRLHINKLLQNAPPGMWSLTGLDLQHATPIPQVAWNFRKDTAQHPFNPITGTCTALPATWSTYPGQRIPLLGQAFTLCLAESPTAWLATSNEALMATLANQPTLFTLQDTLLNLHIDWNQLSHSFIPLYQYATRQGYFPEIEERALQAQWTPWLKFMNDIGHSQLAFTRTPKGLRFSGTIVNPSSDAAPKQRTLYKHIPAPLPEPWVLTDTTPLEQMQQYLSKQNTQTGALPQTDGYVTPRHTAWMVAGLCLTGNFEAAQSALNFIGRQTRATHHSNLPVGNIPQRIHPDGTPNSPHYQIHIEPTTWYLSAVWHLVEKLPPDQQKDYLETQWESISLAADFLSHWEHPDPTILLPTYDPDLGYDRVKNSTSLFTLMGLDCATHVAELLGRTPPESWSTQRRTLETRIRSIHNNDPAPWPMDPHNAWWIKEHIDPGHIPQSLEVQIGDITIPLHRAPLPQPPPKPNDAPTITTALFTLHGQ